MYADDTRDYREPDKNIAIHLIVVSCQFAVDNYVQCMVYVRQWSTIQRIKY